MYVCMYVCIHTRAHTHTHKHTHSLISLALSLSLSLFLSCVYVCVCLIHMCTGCGVIYMYNLIQVTPNKVLDAFKEIFAQSLQDHQALPVRMRESFPFYFCVLQRFPAVFSSCQVW
jgi:hypothetical protein